jgi:hypothetical protein
MPIINEYSTPQHQVLINQSIMKRLEGDVKELKKDISEIKEAILFIKEYTENKKKREDAKWF